MRSAGKLVALLCLTVVAFAANAYASEYFAGLVFPRVLPRPYLEMVSAAIVGAVTAVLVTAIPLTWLFGRRASLAAVVVALPVVAFRAGELEHYIPKDEQRIVVMAWVEMLVYLALLVAGAWYTSSRMQHRNAA